MECGDAGKDATTCEGVGKKKFMEQKGAVAFTDGTSTGKVDAKAVAHDGDVELVDEAGELRPPIIHLNHRALVCVPPALLKREPALTHPPPSNAIFVLGRLNNRPRSFAGGVSAAIVRLDLAWNEITFLPPEIKYLTRLEHLWLNR